MFAAGCPCWWLPLLLPSHPTSPPRAGGACSCPPLLVAAASSTVLSHLPSDSGRVVLSAVRPCWWLQLLLPSHPTSPPRAGGACSCPPLLVVAASILSSSHLPFPGRWYLQLAALVGGCCFYSLLIPPPLPRQVVLAVGCPCWWLLLLLSPLPISLPQPGLLLLQCCFYQACASVVLAHLTQMRCRTLPNPPNGWCDRRLCAWIGNPRGLAALCVPTNPSTPFPASGAFWHTGVFLPALRAQACPCVYQTNDWSSC